MLFRSIDTHGTAFEGGNGWAHIDRSGINLQPENLIDLKPDNFKCQLIRSPGHVRNFLDSIKSRAETVSGIDVAVKGDALCHIGDVAIRLGRKVTFDFKKERFIGDEIANHRLKARAMRQPWHL